MVIGPLGLIDAATAHPKSVIIRSIRGNRVLLLTLTQP
jgi:hypothetical protein